MEDGRVDRTNLEFDTPRVMERLGEWNFFPGKAWLAHIDGDAVDALYLHVQQARLGLEC